LTRKTIAKGISDQFQADIVEMIPHSKENKGFKYFLTCIDIFSKYAWAIPMKTKSADETAKAFTSIFNDGIVKRIPNKIQTDDGKEFFNDKVGKLFKHHNINHFSTNSEFKAAIVERFNRTLKEKMWKYFSEMGNHKWIDILSDLVKNYNNCFHRSIKMTPVEASEKENESIVRKNLYGREFTFRKPKYSIGDKVRLSTYKNQFRKGYKQNYTTEIFTISGVFKDINGVPYYHIKDYNQEEIKGTIYEENLVPYNKEDSEYEVEKVIKTRRVNGQKQYFVKWKGYPESMNSWTLEIN